MEFICHQCGESLVEIIGADGRHDEICDCGAVLTPLESLQDADRLRAYTRSAASFEARGG